MDEQATAVGSPRAVRMLLLLLGAVFGLLILSTVFGSSSASADDGHEGQGSAGSVSSLLGGIVSTVTETVSAPVHQVGSAVSHAVAPVTHPVAAAVNRLPVAKPAADAVAGISGEPAASVTAPVASVVDDVIQRLVDATPLETVIGPRPVASVLDPVANLIDGTAAAVGGEALPIPGPLGVAVDAAAALGPVDAAVAGATNTSNSVITGAALGSLREVVPAAPMDELVSATSASGAMATALAMLNVPVLLVRRRSLLLSRAVPGSPVYDTDSSPD
jgi:hypothetical protein